MPEAKNIWVHTGQLAFHLYVEAARWCFAWVIGLRALLIRNKFRSYINNYLLIIYSVQETMLVFVWDINTKSP